jgi:hypothetical protein
MNYKLIVPSDQVRKLSNSLKGQADIKQAEEKVKYLLKMNRNLKFYQFFFFLET